MSDLIKINENNGIVEIQMTRKPVNALNPELVTGIHQAIDEHTDLGAKALIL